MEHFASSTLVQMFCDLEGTSALRVTIAVPRFMVGAKVRLRLQSICSSAGSCYVRTFSSAHVDSFLFPSGCARCLAPAPLKQTPHDSTLCAFHLYFVSSINL